MPQVMKASTDADLLAMIPALAGYEARESVVCAVFSGKRTGAAFRFDLPTRHRHADYRRVADAIIGMASQIDHADAIGPVIYTDQSFAGQHGIPWRDFAEHLQRRLRRAGFGVIGPFCVAADGWGTIFDPGAPRYELAEITSSPLYRRMPLLDDLGRLPAPDPGTAAAIDAAFERMDSLPDPIEHLERCLVDEPDATMLAELIVLAQSPSRRDVMTMQIAFGSIVGEACAESDAQLHDLQAQTGLSMDELVVREVEAGRLDLDDELSGLMLGRGRLRPDSDRMRRATTMLGTAATNVPDDLRPPLLCMLAWLAWAGGLGSAAGRHVDAALAIDPEYGMAGVLWMVLSRGMVPEWALPQGDPHEAA